MLKFERERKLRERRELKQEKKNEKKQAAARSAEVADSTLSAPGVDGEAESG